MDNNSRFQGCAFVFTPAGAEPVEVKGSPLNCDPDNAARPDFAEYLGTMHAAMTSANIVPFNPGWRADRRKARRAGHT